MKGVVIYLHQDVDITSLSSAWSKSKDTLVISLTDPLKFKDIKAVAKTDVKEDEILVVFIATTDAEKLAELMKATDELEPEAVVARIVSKTGDNEVLETVFSDAAPELDDVSPWVSEEVVAAGKSSFVAMPMPVNIQAHVSFLYLALRNGTELEEAEATAEEAVPEVEEAEEAAPEVEEAKKAPPTSAKGTLMSNMKSAGYEEPLPKTVGSNTPKDYIPKSVKESPEKSHIDREEDTPEEVLVFARALFNLIKRASR